MPHAPRPARPPDPKPRYPRRQPEIGSYTNAAWRRLRAQVLARDPICTAPGCQRPATVADHIRPRRQGGADDLGNLQGLCSRHHGRKTNQHDGGWGLPIKAEAV